MLLKASSEEESMLSTWVTAQLPLSFVYVLIAGGFPIYELQMK